MISIGTVLKGPELSGSTLDKAIMKVSQAAKSLRNDADFGSNPSINIVFHVEGSQGGPDWNGIRDSKFSKSQKLLMIQIAIPSEVINAGNYLNFLIESMHGANAVAFEFFRQRNINFNLKEAEALVLKIKTKIEAEPLL